MNDSLRGSLALCLVLVWLWWETYRNVTQDGQQDVDEEVGIASALEEDTERRKDDGEDDLEDVAIVLLATLSQIIVRTAKSVPLRLRRARTLR